MPSLASQQAFALYKAGSIPQAIDICKRALLRDPSDHDASWILGSSLAAAGRYEESEYHLRRAYEALPSDPMRGMMLVRSIQHGRHDPSALDLSRKLSQTFPNDARVLEMAGAIEHDYKELTACIALLQRAVALDPQRGPAWTILAGAYNQLGDHQLAHETYKKAMLADPRDPQLAGSYAFCSNCWAHLSPADVFEIHKLIDQRLSKFDALPLGPLPNVKDPTRRLRVGLLTADIKEHSVSFFLSSLISARDRDQIELFAYMNVGKGDQVTDRMVSQIDHVRITTAKKEPGVAELIRQDAIDILIDLNGHTGGTGIWLMRSRVAPIQITYLGYCNTSAVRSTKSAIGVGGGTDVRVVDWTTDPEGADNFATEKLVRLDRCFISYTPLGGMPDIGQRTSRPVVFGSFNAIHKISSKTYDLWAQILQEVPQSTLLLKSRPLDIPDVRERVTREFAARNINPARFELRGFVKGIANHLSLYDNIDIALDPMPYNGTTTTCEALIMGVPVIAMLGDRHAARVSASILKSVGCDELIATDNQSYVQLAKALANDTQRTAEYHRTLRDRMLASPVCDVQDHARAWERMLRNLWTDYCQKGTVR